MKYLYLIILLLLLTANASMQTLSNPSELSVLKKKWRITSVNPSNSMLNEDPFQAINETNQAIQDHKDNIRINEIRKRQGKPPEPRLVRTKTPEAKAPEKISTFYTYQIKVQNNGIRIIKKVVWEYVFFDSTTKLEVGRHQFVNDTNLKPNETDNFVMKLLSPPTSVINANNTGKKISDLYIEQINIKSIQYADGSVWQADSK
jgi:hypothetical protein